MHIQNPHNLLYPGSIVMTEISMKFQPFSYIDVFILDVRRIFLSYALKWLQGTFSGGESSHNVREGKGNVSKVVVKHFQKDHTNVE